MDSNPTRQRWESALPSEIEFWRRIIDGTYPNPEWVADMRRRMSDEYAFPLHLAAFVNRERVTRILDVGAGPQTVVGQAGAPGPIEITAVDPLADVYNDLLTEHGLKPRVPTRNGEGERLSELGIGLFDIVYSRNALDHAYDPLTAIRQMIAVCKPEGIVMLVGGVNESLNEHGDGLHQWNFMPLDNGDLVIWQPDNRAISLRSALGGDVHVTASGHDWCQVKIRHAHAANGGRPEAGPSPEVQALLERIAFLEEQISELRRASMAEKARLAPRRASRKTLRKIGGSLSSARVLLGERAYKLVKMRPLLRPVEDLLRRLRTKP